MRGFFIRWVILGSAIGLAAYLIDGIRVSGVFAALGAAAVLGVLNAVFRPLLLILTLPINILSLGLFTFVINAAISDRGQVEIIELRHRGGNRWE